MSDAQAQFSDAPLPWVDLSTGINPHAWDGPRADFAALKRLPDPAEIRALEAAAAASFGVDAAQVVAVAGAETGLRLLPRMLGASSVTIVAPTYGGHEEGWRAAGCAVVLAAWDARIAAAATDALVIVNPNNPDGRALGAAAVLGLRAPGRVLIVDESFVEVDPALSVAAFADERLIVLRSFGKFFGLAGVRLGFVVAGVALAGRLRGAIGDWAVSAEAIAAGRGAYADPGWAKATRELLGRDAARLDALLEGAGFLVLGGTTLFRLCAVADAAGWFARLAEAGLLVRPFAAQPDWLRFGLPGHEDEWARLAEVLTR